MNSEQARQNSYKGLANLEKVLDEVGWKSEKTDTEGLLYVDLSSDNSPVLCAYMDIKVRYERFICYFCFRDAVDEDHRLAVVEFITRANFNLAIGNFEIDLDSGLVRFKASVDFTQMELSDTLLKNTIKSAMDNIEIYGDNLAEVMHGHKDALEAIEACEKGLSKL